jgi:hypothetical protein
VTRSELFSLMTVGMACIAGTVMFLYATILTPIIPEALGHILLHHSLSRPPSPLPALWKWRQERNCGKRRSRKNKTNGCGGARNHGWTHSSPEHHCDADRDGGLVHIANGLVGLLPRMADNL